MPSSPVLAAAEGLPKNLPSENVLSRRALLGALAAAPAAALPAVAEAHETEDPAERCSRLAWELAEALNDYDGGRWMAEVLPTNVSAAAVCMVDRRAREEMNGRTPEDRCRVHADRLAEAMRQVSGGFFDVQIDHKVRLAVVVQRVRMS